MEQQKQVGVLYPVITPPVDTPPLTPAEAAKGYDTVTILFNKEVLLTVDHGQKIKYPKGIHEVPRHLADHWYLRVNDAVPYSKPVAFDKIKQASVKPTAAGKK